MDSDFGVIFIAYLAKNTPKTCFFVTFLDCRQRFKLKLSQIDDIAVRLIVFIGMNKIIISEWDENVVFLELVSYT